jgi:hypothetical protein
MIAFLVGQAIGLPLGLTLVLSISEGLILTTVITVLAERYLFPMPQD